MLFSALRRFLFGIRNNVAMSLLFWCLCDDQKIEIGLLNFRSTVWIATPQQATMLIATVIPYAKRTSAR